MLLVVKELVELAEAGGDCATDDTSDDCDDEGAAESGQLVPALLGRRPLILGHGWESIAKDLFVGECAVSEGGGNGADDGTDDAWKSVEVVNAASVM